MLIDHTDGRVIDVLESRDKAPFDFAQGVVVAWLAANKPGLLPQLQEVTCDMWDGYAEAAKPFDCDQGVVFGTTIRVTVDRTLSAVEGHVMKNCQDRLTECRRQLQNRLPAEQKKELPFDCAQGEGSRWLWVTTPRTSRPSSGPNWSGTGGGSRSWPRSTTTGNGCGRSP